MTKIHCIKSDDYEALYIDEKLFDEGHPLNEGNERVLYFIKVAKEYGVNVNDIKFGYVNLAEHTDYGEFPSNINAVFENIEWEN